MNKLRMSARRCNTIINSFVISCRIHGHRNCSVESSNLSRCSRVPPKNQEVNCNRINIIAGIFEFWWKRIKEHKNENIFEFALNAENIISAFAKRQLCHTKWKQVKCQTHKKSSHEHIKIVWNSNGEKNHNSFSSVTLTRCVCVCGWGMKRTRADENGRPGMSQCRVHTHTPEEKYQIYIVWKQRKSGCICHSQTEASRKHKNRQIISEYCICKLL